MLEGMALRVKYLVHDLVLLHLGVGLTRGLVRHHPAVYARNIPQLKLLQRL